MHFRPLFFLLALAAGLTAFPSALQAKPDKPEVPAPAQARTWQAKWIWTPGDPAPRNSYTYFRKTLDLGSTPKSAKIHLTADSRYIVFVNGAAVGRGPVRSDRRWLYYDTWDISARLKRGKNVIAVLVHHYGEFTFQYMKGRGGLIAEVEAGRSLLARTDSTWRARRSEAWAGGGPRMSIQLGFPEVYDARKEPKGWKLPEFDDSAWATTEEIGAAGMEPWPHLIPRDIPPMREEPLRPNRVLEVTQVPVGSPAQHIDFLPVLTPKLWAAAYVATTLVSPDRREVTLRFGSDDALKVWLNGKEIVSHLISRAAAPDQESARVTLEPGKNVLLAKIVQGHSAWEFYFGMTGSVEGVRQAPISGLSGTGAWAVSGGYAYPTDETLKTGFDKVFAPETVAAQPEELEARLPAGERKSLGWRALSAEAAGTQLISQVLASEPHTLLREAEVKQRDAIMEPESTEDDPHTSAHVRTVPGSDVSFLIDFGREVTGFPHFQVRGAAGGEIIDMGYGEVLQDAAGAFVPPATGKLGRLNPDRDGVHYADRYLCRPGDQVYQTFDKRAFRYMQVVVRNAPAGLDLGSVGIIFSTFPVEEKGTFNCSDERLNSIWKVGRYTCQLNMEDGYTDCPWRERGQWWGDARVEALINYYSFGDTSLIRKALRQHAQSMNEEGMTWGVYPTDWDGGRLPSFTLIWVSTLWDYYQHTGDAELVKELFPKVRTTLDKFFAPRVSAEGLLKDVPYWVFIDWAPVDDKGQPGALNAYYYDALRSAAQMAKLAGDASATDYDRRALDVKRAMNTHLWDAGAHAYRDSLLPNGKLTGKITQQTNSLCVLFDIAPKAEQAAILDMIYAPENEQRVVQAGSPYFSYYQLAALYHAGRDRQALNYIRDHWGKMLDWGATTWWEMWTPGASFCHGWSGGPTYNFPAEIAGIKPLKPGFEEVEVAPHWVGLQYATATVPTRRGDVSVGWQRAAASGISVIRVQGPEDVPVELQLPEEGKVLVNRKAELPAGITRISSPPGTIRFRIEKTKQATFEIQGTKS